MSNRRIEVSTATSIGYLTDRLRGKKLEEKEIEDIYQALMYLTDVMEISRRNNE